MRDEIAFIEVIQTILLCKYKPQLNNPCCSNIFHHFQEFEGNRPTEESLPSFPEITGIFMESKGKRLTGDSLSSYPGVPENFQE